VLTGQSGSRLKASQLKVRRLKVRRPTARRLPMTRSERLIARAAAALSGSRMKPRPRGPKANVLLLKTRDAPGIAPLSATPQPRPHPPRYCLTGRAWLPRPLDRRVRVRVAVMVAVVVSHIGGRLGWRIGVGAWRQLCHANGIGPRQSAERPHEISPLRSDLSGTPRERLGGAVGPGVLPG
jgi:hypothetical protein